MKSEKDNNVFNEPIICLNDELDTESVVRAIEGFVKENRHEGNPLYFYDVNKGNGKKSAIVSCYTAEIAEIVKQLKEQGLCIHSFGYDDFNHLYMVHASFEEILTPGAYEYKNGKIVKIS